MLIFRLLYKSWSETIFLKPYILQQETALAILKSGQNVFLTGSAGTGKTYVLNQYISYLKARKVPVAITASTGIAATHLNGMTIHSWAGFGIKNRITRGNLASMKGKKYLRKHLEETDILIIDEISMLHRSQLEMVDTILKFFKENDEAFGGIQLVVCGDFFQLPPIGNRGERSSDKFAFMSPSWVSAALNVCYLTEQFRQESNNYLNDILNEIRTQSISKKSLSLLTEAQQNTLSGDEIPTRLFTHNYDVDQLNLKQLGELKGKGHKYKAKGKGNSKLVETLKKSVLAPEILELKKDSKVMFVRNNQEQLYVNGTLGTVNGFNDDGFPIIKISSGKKITVGQESWSVQDDHGKILANYNQLPLRLAWAITIHKCQGMTLDEAAIDLSKTFEKGQGYVALSRLKSLNSLILHGFNETALQIDSLVFKADKRFLELSEEVEAKTDVATLKNMATKFMKSCGGLTDEDEISKNKKKIKEKKTKKKSTYLITLDYVEQEKTIEEIAEIRGLSVGTIMGHLARLREDYPHVDFEIYRPDEALIKKVGDAVKKLGEDGKSRKAIFEALDQKVSYIEIKLALAFL